MRIPNTITEAVLEYANFSPRTHQSEDEIRALFTPEGFADMFGNDSDISGWPWTFDQLADEAVRIWSARRADNDRPLFDARRPAEDGVSVSE